MSGTRIHWGRIVIGGLLAEAAILIPHDCSSWLASRRQFPALYCSSRILRHVLPGSALGVSADQIPTILHGTLVELVAGRYLRCLDAQSEPFAYIVAHVLKLVGGACGGFVAQGRRSPSPAQTVHD